jgi:uncharacterized membrane protein
MQLIANNIPRWVFVTLFIVAIIGFSDATFLTFEHFTNKIPPCVTTGCESVLTSVYSEIFGIPVALGGALFYLGFLIGLILFLDLKKEWILRLTLAYSSIGFVFSMWFVFVQAFLLHAFCQYCMLSATTSTTIFIISMYVFIKYRNKELPI